MEQLIKSLNYKSMSQMDRLGCGQSVEGNPRVYPLAHAVTDSCHSRTWLVAAPCIEWKAGVVAVVVVIVELIAAVRSDGAPQQLAIAWGALQHGVGAIE